MEKKVLVGLKRHDQIDDAVSFLQEIVMPAMTVVFLIPYPVEPWVYLPRHCDDAGIGRAATFMSKKFLSQGDWESQRSLAAQTVARARRALRDKVVDVEFELYTGTLRRQIRNCAAEGEFHWIVTPTRSSYSISDTLHKFMALWDGSQLAEVASLSVRKLRCAHE